MQSGFAPPSIDSIVISGDQIGGTAQFNTSFDQISAVSAHPGTVDLRCDRESLRSRSGVASAAGEGDSLDAEMMGWAVEK